MADTNSDSGWRASVETLSFIPKPSVPWRVIFLIMWIVTIIFAVVGVVRIFMHKWFTASLGYGEVFSTDFSMGLKLFLIFAVLIAVATYAPVLLYGRDKGLKRAGLSITIWCVVIGGFIMSLFYHDYLLAGNSEPFNRTDNVFGKDYSFYVCFMPAFWVTWWGLVGTSLLAFFMFLIARINGLTGEDGVFSKPGVTFGTKIGLVCNRYFVVLLAIFGVLMMVGTFFARYVLLYWNHKDEGTEESSAVLLGPTYIDVEGLFSNLNAIYFSVFVELVFFGALIYISHRLYNAFRHYENDSHQPGPVLVWKRPAVMFVVVCILAEGAFFGAIQLKRLLVVQPNEPYIQKKYIEQHIENTLFAYGMEDVQVVEWTAPDKTLSVEELLANPTIKNAPIVPGFVSDGGSRDSHLKGYRIGKVPLYGPVLQVYQQRQQLRPYYQFINIDNVRYRINGEKQMFASAPRELPGAGIVDKGKHQWGSTALQYTHGFGMVVSPVNKVDENGELTFVSKNVPTEVSDPFFNVEPRIYFGEGASGRHILTNIKDIKEFDYATNQSREEYVFPESVDAGIRVDSLIKRLIIALWSYNAELDRNEIAQFLFTKFIDSEKTRAQVLRGPVERAFAVAPFLMFDDTSNVASVTDGRIVWMVNGLTYSKRHPYSRMRGFSQNDRWGNGADANYMRDAVKVTVDAFTGETHFYKIADEPVANAWAKIYPGLFKSFDQMPESVKSQMNYPMELFHVQFDDTYKRYHQKNYLEFYNLEDQWDDADEALGKVTDMKTVTYHATHYLLDPRDLPPGCDIQCEPGDTQYVLMQPFTPSEARNLRAAVMVFQDPENYGKILSLQVPQGEFMPGPEQADSLISVDPSVNSQMTLWERSGAEALNGHTLLLPVGGDVMYIEPIFSKSTMNAYPRLAMVCALYKGRVTSGRTIEEAIRQQGVPIGPRTGLSGK